MSGFQAIKIGYASLIDALRQSWLVTQLVMLLKWLIRPLKPTTSWWIGSVQAIGALVVAVVLFVGPALYLDRLDQYQNKSVQQQWADEDRITEDYVDACHQAGGNWIVGAIDAYCDRQYQMPDFSWYTPPISNPAYDRMDNLMIVSWVGGIMVLLCGPAYFLISTSEAREDRRWDLR